MRIALLPDEYLPESTRVHAKMIHELALELKSRGHTPVVITLGLPQQKKLLETSLLDGVEIWRFKNGPTRGVGYAKRAINESLISFNAWRAINAKVKGMPFDGVVNYSPSIFFGGLVNKIKSVSDCATYLILRDMFPQWAVDQGILKEHSLITRYFRFFERLNYRSSDCIGVMSDANLVLFKKSFPSYKNVKVLMNWADTAPSQLKETEVTPLRDTLDLHDKVIYFYGGNIGHAQDMQNLLKLARSMLHSSRAHFLFVGQGDEVELVKRLKVEWSLNNLTYLPSVSQEEFKSLLGQVDVGLFSLSRLHTAHNFPGKLLGYMAQSLPILGSVNLGNDLIDEVNDSQSGCVFVNGDDESLYSAACELLENEKYRVKLGSNANVLLHERFSVESAADNILEALEHGARNNT